jgi:glycosyltransferase involved in cell wall biosynthesis
MWSNRLLERRVMERCAHVVTSTVHLRDALRERYGHLPADKFTAILNGYDEADFAAHTEPPARGDRFVVVHAGSINADFRDPRPLFRVLRRLIDNGKLERDRLTLRFIGGGEYAESPAIRTALAETELVQQVEFVRRVPFAQALRELGRAELLLLLQASTDTVGLVPAKLYEYLRTQKPILAMVYPGATSEVLGITGGGWAVDPRDETALEEAVAVAYSAWKSDDLRTHAARLDALRQFDRKTLTRHLADVFERLRRPKSADFDDC